MALDTLTARLARINYHDISTWSESGIAYLIAITEEGTTVRGHMAKPILGEQYAFYGEMAAQNGKGREGVLLQLL